MPYQTSFSSYSSVKTPAGKKSVSARLAERNGVGKARLQKEKNGEIVKDEEIVFTKEALWFFRDEIEKQGFSPNFAVKNWNRPGVRGSIARGYGKMFSPGGALNPSRMQRINTAVHTAARPENLALGPEFALATAKGFSKAEAYKSAIPMIKKNPRVADAVTYWEQNVPSHLFGDWYSNAVDKMSPVAKFLTGA